MIDSVDASAGKGHQQLVDGWAQVQSRYYKALRHELGVHG